MHSTSLSSRAISSAVFGALVKSCRFTQRAVLNSFILPDDADPPKDNAVDIPDRIDAPADEPSVVIVVVPVDSHIGLPPP